MKKILLKEIQLSDWRSLNLKVKFNDNETIINGKNELGKSSLFHAWCWLLSGYTDSVNVKNFNLFNENEELTPDTPIASVKATVFINDIEYTLERRAKATFRRTRGTDEYVKSSSDTYTLLIDNIEVSVSNWNEFISNNICSHEMIRFLLSGDFLANLTIEDKDKARQVLLSIVGEITDDDYIGDYSCIIPQLDKGYSLNQIEEQAKNKKTDIDRQIVKLESDIKSKQQLLAEYSAIDYSSLQTEINNKKKTIVDIDNTMLGNAESIKPILGQRDAIFDLINSKTLKLNKCRNIYLNAFDAVRNEIKGKISNVERHNQEVITRCEQKQKEYEYNCRTLDELKRGIKNSEAFIEDLRKQRDEIKSRVFVAESCSYCGQELPADTQEELKVKFNERKQKEYEYVVAQGKRLASKIEDDNKRIAELEEIVSKGVELEELQSIEILEQQLKTHESTFTPFEKTNEYAILSKEIEELKASIPEMPKNDNEGLTAMKKTLMSEIDVLNQQLGLKLQCDKLKEEIADLQDKHKALGIDIALCERTIMKVKEYREEQASIVSQRINNNLRDVTIDMFRTQKDGSKVPDCIVRGKRGVQYATINNSAKTLINIELQRLMMSHFNIQLPIWIDECKNFDSEHLPKIEGQHILMFASDSPMLIIV